MKNLYVLGLFTLLSLTTQAQTICELYDPIFNAVDKGKYKKAEPILLKIIQQKVNENNPNELVCFGYAHYDLGIIYSDEKFERFNVEVAFDYLNKSITILNQAKSISLKATEDADRVIGFAKEQIADLLKNYPALANVVKASENDNSLVNQTTTANETKLSTQLTRKSSTETAKTEFKQEEKPEISNAKTVTLVVSGQGKTQEEAQQNALRSAIEQAFGTFISSKTEILNDNLVKDEIISISNGNIEKFEIISNQELPNGLYASSLKATVSITKLTAFSVSKGWSVEFKGGLFAANILLKELYDKNELIAWQNTRETIYNFIKNGFDYSISASSPILYKEDIYKVPLKITSEFNSNTLSGLNLLYDFMKASSMSANEAKDYINLGKKIYPLIVAITQNKYGKFYFRNELVRNEISNLPYYLFQSSLAEIKIKNELEQFSLKDYLEKGIKNKTKLAIEIEDGFYNYPSFMWNNGDISGLRHNMDFNLKIIDDNSNYDKEEIYIYNQGGGTEKLSDFLESRGSFLPDNKQLIDYILSNMGGGAKQNFIFLNNIVFNTFDEEILRTNIRPICSYISILTKGKLFNINLNDLRSLNELKKISNYEVHKN